MPEGDFFLDRLALGRVFKDPRTLIAFEALMRQALDLTPAELATLEAEIAANFLMPSFVNYFGGVGDGVTNNDAQFAAAEADVAAQIYLPDGDFLTTLAQTTFTKRYWGPGKIICPTAAMPGRFSYIATTPALWPTQGATGFFRGGSTAVEPEWHVIGPSTREYLTARYFEAGFIPHPVWYEVKSGASGWLTASAGVLAIGAGAAVLTSADGIAPGDTIGFAASMDGAITDTVVVATVVGATITFAPVLTTAYNPYAVIMKGKRTWAGVHYAKVTGEAGGDVYGGIARMVQRYQPKAGQTHVYETSTVGQYGGDINFEAGSSGTYGTGWESQYYDNGNDVAVIAQVDSFIRTNDAGARSAGWFGTLFQSGGTAPVDAGHVLAGLFRVGLDTVRADLTEFLAPGDNYNAAISTALGHRWIMNSTANPAGRTGSTKWPTLFGNTPGDMFIESGNDGLSDFIALRFNRAPGLDGRLRLRPNALQCNMTIAGAQSLIITQAGSFGTTLLVGTDLTVNGNAAVAGSAAITGAMNANSGAVNTSFIVGAGLRVWGGAPPGAQPSITGVLSAVADANAKAVLTSIIASLVAYGLDTDATT